MKIENFLENNSIFIIPDNFKNTMLKILNNSPLLNIKIITLGELKRKIIFDYNEKTIVYLMRKKNITYNNAFLYIENLYYLTSNDNNHKLAELNILKELLEKEKLLVYDNYFLDTLKSKDIYIYGFDYLYKFDIYLINKIKAITNVKIIFEENTSYQHPILKFKNINEEVEFIANEILNKINLGIDINNIFLANYNTDYELTIKRVFDFYNIPINLNSNFSLYDTKIGLELLNNLNNYENILNSITEKVLYDNIIDILNKYYFIKDFQTIKDILIEEFRRKKIATNKYKNAINLIELKNNQINDNSYVFLLGFNEKSIPKIYKNDDLINDSEKNELLENTEQKNQIEKEISLKIIKKIKNLTITYSEQGLKEIFYPSTLISMFEVNNLSYNSSLFSHVSNKYNLALLLDDQIKYGKEQPELSKLFSTYPNLKYLTYQNQYTKINKNLIKDFFKDGLYLSYTKINTYNECAFKYYLDYILKLNIYEETFEAYLGNLCHYILSKIYNEDFDFHREKMFFLKNQNFILTPENNIFIDKMCEELEMAILELKKHYQNTLFKEIKCEKNIKIEIDGETKIIFTGIIDKTMRFQDKIAIIDYKTYSPNIDLSLINYGLSMQLPIYIYLIKNILPNSKIIGIYLQYITRNILAYNQTKTLTEIKKENLKLIGYTIDKEEIIEEFDNTYANSKFIKGMSLTSKGFNRFAKLLKEKDFDILADLAEKNLKEVADNILNSRFDISPKILEKNNLSCTYCKYKSICFVNYDNYKYISADKDLTFLGGEDNEIMD